MIEILSKYMPNLIELFPQFFDSIVQTLLMLVIVGSISLLFGIIFGVILVVTREGDIMENKVIYTVLGKIIDLFRAIPFVILIMVLSDITKIISGTSIGLKGSLFEAMGLTPFEIMVRVYLKESIPSIIRATTITFISLIGLTAIVGAIGGGGVGAFCYNYGYSKQNQDIIWGGVVALVLITIIIQSIGNYFARKTTH